MTAVQADVRVEHRQGAPSRGDVPGWVGGAGALGFTATVVAQNILRAGGPTNDSSPREVLTYYADHRAITFVLAIGFVLGVIGMAMFLGGGARRLLAGGRLGGAVVGGVGAPGVMALFPGVAGAR